MCLLNNLYITATTKEKNVSENDKMKKTDEKYQRRKFLVIPFLMHD